MCFYCKWISVRVRGSITTLQVNLFFCGNPELLAGRSKERRLNIRTQAFRCVSRALAMWFRPNEDFQTSLVYLCMLLIWKSFWVLLHYLPHSISQASTSCTLQHGHHTYSCCLDTMCRWRQKNKQTKHLLIFWKKKKKKNLRCKLNPAWPLKAGAAVKIADIIKFINF